MLSRRQLLVGAAVAAALSFAQPAPGLAWKDKYPEITFAAVPDENASGMTDRYGPLMTYLTKELGVPVKLRIAQDYAAVIEGQKAGQIHIAQYGPASYARAFIVGAKVEPFGIMVNADGGKGYHAVLYVKKDSPYQKIEDLKGKNLGLVDPNSTSGNNVPRFAMDKLGIDAEKYFSKVVYTGSHENAVIALAQGSIDGAWNWWNDKDESNLHRMDRKGMEVGGKKIKYDDFRIIFTSDKIVNSPVAYLSEMPDDLKKVIRESMLSFDKKDPDGFKKLTDVKSRIWDPATHKEYEPVVELIKFVDRLKRQKR